MDDQETTEQQTTTDLNSRNVCICGKVCKNLRGLKIHMGKMLTNSKFNTTHGATWWDGGGGGSGWKPQWPQPPCVRQWRGYNRRGTQYKEQRWTGDATKHQEHSKHRHRVETRRKKINRPNSNAKGEWEQFDIDDDAVLYTTLAARQCRQKDRSHDSNYL